jgi:hypothetical protein
MIKLICIKPHTTLIEGNVYDGKVNVSLKANFFDIPIDGDIYDTFYFIPSINRRYDKDFFMTLAEWRDKQINEILND